jgi:hypothetical protein
VNTSFGERSPQQEADVKNILVSEDNLEGILAQRKRDGLDR